MANRYTDLTATERAHVDAYIEDLAEGNQTEITHAVTYWVEQARGVLGDEECLRLDGAWEVRGDLRRKYLLKSLRHCLAMILDATVRPTLEDSNA